MSAGVALAWATEASEKGIVSLADTIVPLRFGDAGAYQQAMWHLARGENEFYRLLASGTLRAAERFGGKDFACVLGQEMAGYATGEVFFVSQALGLRHSHLDTGGYSFDQKHIEKNAAKAVEFLVEDERSRCFLTSMVSCLFARGVYTEPRLAECLAAVGYDGLGGNIEPVSQRIRCERWRLRMATGYDPDRVDIPKRFSEVVTWKGPIDWHYLSEVKKEYSRRIHALAAESMRERDKPGEEKEKSPLG